MAHVPLSPRSFRKVQVKWHTWLEERLAIRAAEAGEVFVPTPLPEPNYEEAVSPPMAPIDLSPPHEYIEDEPRRVENEEEVVLAHPPGSLSPSYDELFVEVKQPTPVKRCSPSTNSPVASRVVSSRRNKSPRGTAEKSEEEAAASSTAGPRYGNRTRRRPRVKNVEKKKDDNIRSRSPVRKENSVIPLKKRGALKKLKTVLDVSSESEKPQDIESMEGTIEARMAAGAIGMGDDEQGGEIEEHDDHARDREADEIPKYVAEMKGHLTRLTSSLAGDEGRVKSFHRLLVRELLPAMTLPELKLDLWQVLVAVTEQP
ncbi:uncharacterized protein LOC110858134 [Folsomia candida]|uniref:Uncharacterized protein n=1 Tax=Folsomia candida TaxID=158441 RepID=A0A226DFZ0_FOLCA|nr:uncharacterized protein LOC110858134 [Folsomia candida]OXA43898.1 hypothetical protein Fcan01_21041 [Folsomia candida]